MRGHGTRRIADAAFACFALMVVHTHNAAAAAVFNPSATRPATHPAATQRAAGDTLFVDAADGAFDVSNFLSTRTGFLPVIIPITEPAVGYGAGAGLTFFHDKPRVVQTPAGPRVIPPNATVVFGMATANGSWAGGAGHLHQWNDGRIRYLIGGGYASLNLDWFGQSDAFAGRAFSYNIEGAAFLQKLTLKLGESDFFVGPTQRVLATDTEFDFVADLPPIGPDLGVRADELDGTVSGLGVTIGYDTRNSMFSPTRGTKAFVAEEFDELDDAEDQWAGGTGFRYLIARQYDLRLGCDVARGPDDWGSYVTIGTGWLRH